METTKYTLEQIELDDRMVDVEVTVTGEWNNDGIGGYEFWGQKCYDKGRNYFSIVDWSWDKSGFNPMEIKIIEICIESKIEDWEKEME